MNNTRMWIFQKTEEGVRAAIELELKPSTYKRFSNSFEIAIANRLWSFTTTLTRGVLM